MLRLARKLFLIPAVLVALVGFVFFVIAMFALIFAYIFAWMAGEEE